MIEANEASLIEGRKELANISFFRSLLIENGIKIIEENTRKGLMRPYVIGATD